MAGPVSELSRHRLLVLGVPLVALLLSGCAAVEEAVGGEDPCARAERLGQDLQAPLDQGAETVGDLLDNAAGLEGKADEALEAGLECLRQQPLPD